MPQELSAQIKTLELQLQTLQAEYQSLRLQKNSDVQQVLYRIAERATAGLSLHDFLKEVHSLLAKLLPPPICMSRCRPCVRHAELSYYVDERDGSNCNARRYRAGAAD